MTETRKTYVLLVSTAFPHNHARPKEKTNFPELILQEKKIHTIRANYKLWEHRFKQIEKDEAVLSIRHWESKPYKSSQVHIQTLTKADGIGLQSFEITPFGPLVDGNLILGLPPSRVAANDGLSPQDFSSWFHNSFLPGTPKALIHFTSFRYKQEELTDSEI
ncbi:MAG: hypothetical protein ABI169_16175 [Chitinophagaceae bacterium]